MSRITNVLALLRGQLWLVPSAMGLGAFGLAALMLSTGLGFENLASRDMWWLYSGDAGTARDLLAALLSGMMTMISLVVSMTFVILTLAASQLGPRLIWNFIGDRQIQTVLGFFLGTVIYLVVVLRTLDDTLGAEGVPHFAITTGSVLTLGSLFALLFYVHKIARSIISDTVVERVAAELRAQIDGMLPEEDGEEPADRGGLPPPAGWVAIGRAGYIQTIDYRALVRAAERADAVLAVTVRAGHFVLRQGRHVEVRASAPLAPDVEDEIRRAFVVGPERSPAQDLEYAVRQLVEVALRGLSPGINDPFTAIAVVDRLGAALEAILTRAEQPRRLGGDAGTLRVLADRSDAPGLVAASFDQIRQAAAGHPAVLIHVADTLAKLAPALRGEAAREAAALQLESLAEAAARLPARQDRLACLRRIEDARAALARPEGEARPTPDGARAGG